MNGFGSALSVTLEAKDVQQPQLMRHVCRRMWRKFHQTGTQFTEKGLKEK